MPRHAIDYANTIIYKLVCNDVTIKDCYVGHTTHFQKRKQKHKACCNNENDKYYNLNVYKFIRNNGGWLNWSMVEIEQFSCSNSNEACARERYWVETLQSTLNSQIPTRTKKEYNEQYYDQNRDELSEKYKQQVTCECGRQVRKHELQRHKRSNIHNELLEINHEEI